MKREEREEVLGQEGQEGGCQPDGTCTVRNRLGGCSWGDPLAPAWLVGAAGMRERRDGEEGLRGRAGRAARGMAGWACTMCGRLWRVLLRGPCLPATWLGGAAGSNAMAYCDYDDDDAGMRERGRGETGKRVGKKGRKGQKGDGRMGEGEGDAVQGLSKRGDSEAVVASSACAPGMTAIDWSCSPNCCRMIVAV